MSEKQRLPPGWRWMRLGDVAKYINGLAFRPEDWVNKGLPIIRIENLTSADALFNYYDSPVEKKYIVDNGDLLISWSATLEAFIWSRGKSILNQHIFKVEEDGNVIDRKFLYYIARFVMNKIRAQVHGATMKHITKGKFEAIEIPVPLIKEQRRIVAVLDEKLMAVSQARQAAQAQLEAAKALSAAYLRAVFDSPETSNWPYKRLGDFCELLPARSIALDADMQIQTITSACLSETGFQAEGIKPGKMWSYHVPECLVSPGEILIARSNTEELVGRVSLYEGKPENIVASDLTIRIWTSKGNFDSRFLTYYLSFLFLSGYWRDKAGGASQSMKKIRRGQILNLEVPMPPLEKQTKLSGRLFWQLQECTRITSLLDQQNRNFEALPASYLREAFNGDL